MVLARDIKSIEARKRSLELEAHQLLPPPARHRIHEAEKKQAQDYSALKSQRLHLIKQNRILQNVYPNGLIGQAEREGRCEASVFAVSARSVTRTDNISKMRKTSPDIEFLNPSSGMSSPSLPRYQLKRFPEEFKHQYHDTHQALFVPASSTLDTNRREKLTQLTRGNRQFNIVTGTSY